MQIYAPVISSPGASQRPGGFEDLEGELVVFFFHSDEAVIVFCKNKDK
jgi:hypothetical protein